MSLNIRNADAWVLSPYCFCENRPWLSINGLDDADGDAGTGGGITPIAGLSPEDTALLAALLTALAIFLFLLFLLLCLFCPCGLCCRKMCRCCRKDDQAKTSNSKNAMKVVSVGKGKSVNLTAIDMKIPRAWADNDIGYSDSELNKRRKIWNDTDNSRWLGFGDKYGHTNNAVLEGDFKGDSWLSTYQRNNTIGTGYTHLGALAGWRDGNKEIETEKMALNEFYHGSTEGKLIPSTLQHKSNSHKNVAEKLMTPYAASNFSTHCNSTAISCYDNTSFVRDEVKPAYVTTGRNETDDQAVSTSTKHGLIQSRDVSEGKSKKEVIRGAAESVHTTNSTVDSIHSNNRAVEEVHEISLKDTSGLIENSLPVLGYGSGKSQSNTINHMTTTSDNAGDLIKEINVIRNTADPRYNMTMETTSTYMKRVIEETETVTMN